MRDTWADLGKSGGDSRDHEILADHYLVKKTKLKKT